MKTKTTSKKTSRTNHTRSAAKAKAAVDRQVNIPQEDANALLTRTKLQVDRKAVHRAGPRGFRLGPAWLKSIVEAKGAALRPANLPKLLATAQVKGVPLPKSKGATQKDIVAAVARAL